MEAKVTWKEKLAFTATADESGFEVPLDAKADVGGDESGFRPMEMIAMGLAGCTAMDVVSILQKKRQEITSFEVQLHAERAEEHPKVFTHAVIEYIVAGYGVEESALVRAIELSATRYCPAQAMFNGVFPIELKYKIFEDPGNGERRLVAEGEYIPAEAAAQV